MLQAAMQSWTRGKFIGEGIDFDSALLYNNVVSLEGDFLRGTLPFLPCGLVLLLLWCMFTVLDLLLQKRRSWGRGIPASLSLHGCSRSNRAPLMMEILPRRCSGMGDHAWPTILLTQRLIGWRCMGKLT